MNEYAERDDDRDDPARDYEDEQCPKCQHWHRVWDGACNHERQAGYVLTVCRCRWRSEAAKLDICSEHPAAVTVHPDGSATCGTCYVASYVR